MMTKQAAFLALYTEHTIFEKYQDIPEASRRLKVPMVMMVQRWDGTIGFPGGLVNDGENIREAALREVHEELGVNLAQYKNKAEFVCSNQVSSQLEAHLFSLRLPFHEYKEIFDNFHKSENVFSEITGVISPHFRNYPEHRVFSQFLNSNFAPTVKEEVLELRKFLDWEWDYPTK